MYMDAVALGGMLDTGRFTPEGDAEAIGQLMLDFMERAGQLKEEGSGQCS